LSRPRKQIAVFTPWPPQANGSSFSRRLVEELIAHADIDVIVRDEGGDDRRYDRSLEPRIGLKGEVEFEWMHALRDYDHFLYVLGDSSAYLHGLEALLKRPGLVLGDGHRFTEIYRSLAEERHPFKPWWLLKKLKEMYGERIPKQRLEQIADGDENAADVLMSGEIQAHAERILVKSSAAAEALRRDPRPGDVVAEVEVLADVSPGGVAERCAELLDL
jgi:hypothetical protein